MTPLLFQQQCTTASQTQFLAIVNHKAKGQKPFSNATIDQERQQVSVGRPSSWIAWIQCGKGRKRKRKRRLFQGCGS